MPPLLGLVASLVLNYIRHRRGATTICSTTRRAIGPKLFVMGWATLTAWLLPHYINPFKGKENSVKRTNE